MEIFSLTAYFRANFLDFPPVYHPPLQGLRIGDGTLSLFGIKTVHGWLYAAFQSPFKSLINNVIASFFRFSDFICTFIV